MASVWKRSIGYKQTIFFQWRSRDETQLESWNSKSCVGSECSKFGKAPRLWWMLGSSSWLLWPSLLTVQCWCAAFGVLRIGHRVGWSLHRHGLREVLLLQKLPRLLTRQADIEADKLWWQRVHFYSARQWWLPYQMSCQNFWIESASKRRRDTKKRVGISSCKPAPFDTKTPKRGNKTGVENQRRSEALKHSCQVVPVSKLVLMVDSKWGPKEAWPC